MPPSLSDIDFMWRAGGMGLAALATQWPGCQSIRVISTTLVKGPGAIFKIFPTCRLRRGFQEGHPVTSCFRKATEPPRTQRKTPIYLQPLFLKMGGGDESTRTFHLYPSCDVDVKRLPKVHMLEHLLTQLYMASRLGLEE